VTPKVLFVSPDHELAEECRQRLLQAGFAPLCVGDGGEAEPALVEDFSAIVLDTQLANPDARSVCAKMRSARVTTPVLMLTSAECVKERIAGLECGADDCLEKPFEFEELRARLKALIRRDRVVRSAKIAIDDLIVDSAARVAVRAGREIRLTQREFTLLEALALNEGKVVSRAVIQSEVWGDGFSSSNTVDVHIRNLRLKIDECGSKLIHTVFGVGYVLRSNACEHKDTPANPEGLPE
jgi:DNA-binding response OmpR family regulator